MENSNIVDRNHAINIDQNTTTRTTRTSEVNGRNSNENRFQQQDESNIRQEHTNARYQHETLNMGRNTRQTYKDRQTNNYTITSQSLKGKGPSVDDAMTVLKLNDEITGGKRFDRQSAKSQKEMRDTMALNFAKVADKKKLTGKEKEAYIDSNVNKAQGAITQMGKIQSDIK